MSQNGGRVAKLIHNFDLSRHAGKAESRSKEAHILQGLCVGELMGSPRCELCAVGTRSLRCCLSKLMLLCAAICNSEYFDMSFDVYLMWVFNVS